MKIQEIPLTQADTDSLLLKLKSLIAGVETDPPAVDHDILQALSDSVKLPLSFSEAQKEELWALSYRLWNKCVSISNAGSEGLDAECQARLRQAACDMLLLAGGSSNVPFWEAKVGSLLLKTGTMWNALKKYPESESCLRRAADLLSSMTETIGNEALGINTSLLRLDIRVAQAKNSCKLKDLHQAGAHLHAAADLLEHCPQKTLEIAEEYLILGKEALCGNDSQAALMAVSFLEQAYELCSGILKGSNQAAAEAANSVRLSALKFLARAHLQGSRYSECLRCTSLLKLNSKTFPAWAHFIELKSLASLGRHDEAVHEFRSLCKAKDISLDVFCAAFEEVIQADTTYCIDAAKESLKQVCSVFNSDNRVILFCVERLLMRPSPVRYCAALDVLKDERLQERLQLPCSQNSEDRSALFAILWNCCADSFRKKEYQSALKMVEASLLFVDDDSKAARGKALRVICLCHMAMSQHDLAMDSICLAEEFKLCLQSQNTDRAESTMMKMLRCSDFDSDYLTLASHEAMASGHTNLAATALKRLLALYAEGKGAKTAEASVIRSLISLQETEASKEGEIQDLFLKARERSDKVNADIFFGEGEDGEKEMRWFAVSALKRGISSAKEHAWESASHYLSCSSLWFTALPKESQGELGKLSLLLSAASLLSTLSSKPESKAIVKEVELALMKCETAFAGASAADAFTPYLRLLAFELKCRTRDSSGQLRVLELCKSTANFTADHFFRLSVCSASARVQHPCMEVAIASLKAGMTLLSSKSSPDYTLALTAMRAVISACERSSSGNEELLKLYRYLVDDLSCFTPFDPTQRDLTERCNCRESCNLVKEMPRALLPAAEASWLIATAWNRAPVLIKFQRYDEAEKWMKLALEYIDISSEMHGQKGMMEKALADLDTMRNHDASSFMEE